MFDMIRRAFRSLVAYPKKMTSSGQVFTGAGNVFAVLIGKDGVNDVTLTVYDNTEASGTEVLPTQIYDGTRKGMDGFTQGYILRCKVGCYVEITCAGSCEVTVHYNKAAIEAPH